MKTKETLHTTMCNNIGQVRIENAQKEIERLNRQYNTNSWRTDNSPFMFVEDETDDDVHNPCELIEGYVWVTCEPKVKSTREQALAWWNELSQEKQIDLQYLYKSPSRHPSNAIGLTDREIEEIWRKETFYTLEETKENIKNFKLDQKQYSQEEVDRLLDQQAARTTAQVLRSNQKQFKQFDESLFKAYIDKFSDEDKLKALIVVWNKISYSQRKQFLIDFS